MINMYVSMVTHSPNEIGWSVVLNYCSYRAGSSSSKKLGCVYVHFGPRGGGCLAQQVTWGICVHNTLNLRGFVRELLTLLIT